MRLKASLAVVAATCAVVVLAGPALGTTSAPCQSGPGPAGAGGVNVYEAGGAVMWCSPSIIKQNFDIATGTQFPVHGAPPLVLTQAISIHRLLIAAGVDPTTVTAVQISHDFGAWSVLKRPGLRDPATSPGLVPIVQIQGSTTIYLRPMRNPNDNNQSDAYNAKNGAAIDIYVEAPQLIVSCAVLKTDIPNTSSTTPGKPVTFGARVENPGAAGGAVNYRWIFGDGQTETAGPKVRHSFDQGGSNPLVYVWVRGTNGSAGVCDAQQVTVRTKANVPPVKPGGNNHPSTTGNGPSGGVGVGGNSGTTNTNTTPTSSTGTNPSQGNQTTPTAGSTTTPTQRHTPRTSPIRSGTQGPHGGTIVTGRLISAVTPVSPTQLAGGNVLPTTQINQRVAPAAAVDSGSVKPIAGIVGACAIVLLLISGAGRELRSLRRSIASARLG